MKRIQAAIGILAVSTAIAFAPAGASAGNPGDANGVLAFDVALDGRPIGQHSLTFERRADNALAVDIAIDLEVKFGPFTVYDYSHRNATLWRDGVLAEMRSETVDDGERHTVEANGGETDLRVVTDGEREYTTARTTLPTTYWMASTVAQDRLVNSQTGELLEVRVIEVGPEEIPGPDGPLTATHYRMEGDLEIDLWYDAAGILVGLAFEARGSDVTYRLVERVNPLPVAEAMPNLTARHQAAAVAR